jgi:nucleoside-diphosphate-sugar epimerase
MESFGKGCTLKSAASGIETLKDAKVLITGASGWLGRETLCLLQNCLGNIGSPNFVLAASTNKRIQVHNNTYDVQALDTISKKARFDLILHYAFSTQEKLNILGKDKYFKMNRDLTNSIFDLVDSNNSAKILMLSSGTASFVRSDSNSSESKYLYGELKKELEQTISGPNSLALRVWSTTGHHLGNDPRYAITEFIDRALSQRPIEIQLNLLRTYVDSQTMIHTALNYLLAGGFGIINSGGIQIDLVSLAEKIIQDLKSGSTCRLLNTEDRSDLNYVSPSSEIPKEHWSGDIGLSEQILNTSKGFT